MSARRKQKNTLTKKEQSTTTAYKMMSEKIKNLEASLKKTQDESEKIRAEKYKIEKENAILEYKQKKNFLTELFRFISAVGIGFSVNYFTAQNYTLALCIGIPAVIIFIITTVSYNK